MSADPCEYVREHYGLHWLRVGVRVVAGGMPGTVVSANHYVIVRHDNPSDPNGYPYHPSDVEREL